MRTICVVTGTRADYGLLYWLMKEIEADFEIELQIIATGMHLSPEFGLTYREIEKDFKINKKIEMLLSSDTSIGISKSMGLAQISFSEALDELEPDIVVLLGDRYEIFSAAAACLIARIPIAHLHGGETTEGAFDEAIRHSITKMSHLHFTATSEYRNRVIQLGEQSDRVFDVGGLGIDNIVKLPLLSRDEFQDSIGFLLNTTNFLITFHPVTLDDSTAEEQFQACLDAVSTLKDTNIIFTKANADTDGRIINRMIDSYVAENKSTSIAFDSLGQIRYLSALQFMDAVIGNSSSGLLEAPSFKIATINIGERQAGRIKAESVIDCHPDKLEILKAINMINTTQFRAVINSTKNPYGEGGASFKIINIIKEFDLTHILKKKFNNIKCIHEEY